MRDMQEDSWVDEEIKNITNVDLTIKKYFNKYKKIELVILKCFVEGVYIGMGHVIGYDKCDFMEHINLSKYKIDKIYKHLRQDGYIDYVRYGGCGEYGDPCVGGCWEITTKGRGRIEGNK